MHNATAKLLPDAQEDEAIRKAVAFHAVPAEVRGRLVAVATALAKAETLDEVMAIVRVVARELAGADGATFVLRDGDNCYYADEDAISPLWKGQRFPLHDCVSGWVMMRSEPISIQDINYDARVPVEAYRPTFVKSMAMVPLPRRNPIGAIGNYWATHHKPSPEEMRMLQALADVTAPSLERVLLKTTIRSHG